MRTAHSYDQVQSCAPPAPASTPETMIERCQAMLFTLAELGTDFARQIHATATRAAELPGVDHGPMLDRASQAFDRTTTGVRRTVLLIEKLAHPTPPAATATRPARIPSLQAAETTPTRLERAETLHPERPDRLERVERPESLGARPLEHVVAGILADFGIEPSAQPNRDQPPHQAANDTEPREQPQAPCQPDPPQRTLLRVPATIPDG